MTEQTHYPDLAGKVAVVTGGSRGIGATTARALAANGAAVAVIGRDEEALAGIAAGIQERGERALAVRADCTVQAELERGGPEHCRTARTRGHRCGVRRRQRHARSHGRGDRRPLEGGHRV